MEQATALVERIKSLKAIAASMHEGAFHTHLIPEIDKILALPDDLASASVSDREAVARQPVPPRPAPASAPVRSAASAAPRVLRQAAPRYPEAALRSRQSGQVQVAFTIDGDGNVEAPRVVASDLPNAFERAALAAVSRWKFEARGTQHATTTTVRFDPPSS